MTFTAVRDLKVGDSVTGYGQVTKIIVGKKSGNLRITFDSNHVAAFTPNAKLVTEEP